MGSGRSDYYYGMMPGQPTLAASQSGWYIYKTIILNPGLSDQLVNYLVPANHVLYLCSGIISCSQPGMQIFIIWVDDDVLMVCYYDQLFTFPIDSKGGYKITAGQRLKVTVWNDDNIDNGFYVALVGFEEYLVS